MSDTAGGDPIDIGSEIDGPRAVVTVRGELDLLSAPALNDHLDGLGPGITEVEVDLMGVSFVDSSGLNALLTTRRRFDENGGSFRVSAASDIALRLFEVAGVREILGPD